MQKDSENNNSNGRSQLKEPQYVSPKFSAMIWGHNQHFPRAIGMRGQLREHAPLFLWSEE